MATKKQTVGNTNLVTKDQVSAGGVAFRRHGSQFQVAIVSVKPSLRWQLPKGIVDPGETTEITAVREVREEAGIETDLVDLIETVQYWYQRVQYGQRIRYHKYVHFFLLKYRAGDVADHDHEVAESRWVTFEEALEMLEFKSERHVVEKARTMIENLAD
ncbi:MAG TPA: NUDIX hydrolase [Anaerolineales bacterium]|nr:NUDIX hydrolase [Anaerolineales bacterium]